jgi:hypothetical protein
MVWVTWLTCDQWWRHVNHCDTDISLGLFNLHFVFIHYDYCYSRDIACQPQKEDPQSPEMLKLDWWPTFTKHIPVYSQWWRHVNHCDTDISLGLFNLHFVFTYFVMSLNVKEILKYI